jgi:hypothetical protein
LESETKTVEVNERSERRKWRGSGKNGEERPNIGDVYDALCWVELTLDDVVLALRGATSLPLPCVSIGECAWQSKQTLLKIIINFSQDLLFCDSYTSA